MTLLNEFSLKKIQVECSFCHNFFQRYISTINPTSKNLFCSTKHKTEWQKLNSFGPNNNNYNKKWSKEKRLKQSIERKEDYIRIPELRYIVGKARRGKKRSEEEIKKGKETIRERGHPWKGKHHSQESKMKIGEKSKIKFTSLSYRKNFREKMEKKHYWIPLENKSDYNIYYKESNWIEQMFNYCDKNELVLLKEQGVFNCLKNKNGIVRDHKYSRYSGFLNKVFPEILRHPCNCSIITSLNNLKKGHSKNTTKDSITLESLFENIINFKIFWKEQQLCLKLIKEYKNGKTWERRKCVSK